MSSSYFFNPQTGYLSLPQRISYFELGLFPSYWIIRRLFIHTGLLNPISMSKLASILIDIAFTFVPESSLAGVIKEECFIWTRGTRTGQILGTIQSLVLFQIDL